MSKNVCYPISHEPQTGNNTDPSKGMDEHLHNRTVECCVTVTVAYLLGAAPQMMILRALPWALHLGTPPVLHFPGFGVHLCSQDFQSYCSSPDCSRHCGPAVCLALLHGCPTDTSKAARTELMSAPHEPASLGREMWQQMIPAFALGIVCWPFLCAVPVPQNVNANCFVQEWV